MKDVMYARPETIKQALETERAKSPNIRTSESTISLRVEQQQAIRKMTLLLEQLND